MRLNKKFAGVAFSLFLLSNVFSSCNNPDQPNPAPQQPQTEAAYKVPGFVGLNDQELAQRIQYTLMGTANLIKSACSGEDIDAQEYRKFVFLLERLHATDGMEKFESYQELLESKEDFFRVVPGRLLNPQVPCPP